MEHLMGCAWVCPKCNKRNFEEHVPVKEIVRKCECGLKVRLNDKGA